MNWKQLLVSISASVDEELRLRNAYIATENRILRQQITGRVQLSDGDRQALAELGQKLGKKALEEVTTIVKPDTILAWHRKFASQQGGDVTPCQSVGRPRIDQELETLVVRMARENRSWGYDRIVGALANLGLTVSDQTVGNILKRHGIPPAPERKKTTTWREFSRIHMDVLGASAFFRGEIWTWWRFIISYVLSLICLDRGKISLVSITSFLQAWWMLPWLPWLLHVHARVGSWAGLVKEGTRARWALWDEERLRAPSSVSISSDHQGHRRPGLGRVVFLPVVNAHAIRAGPLPHRQGPHELWPYDTREAA